MDIEQVLDQQYFAYFQQNRNVNDQWLLMQNLALGGIRRNILATLEIDAGQRVMDLGCGFGTLSLDLAAKLSIDVAAVDSDEHKLRSALEITGLVEAEIGVLPGEVTFFATDAYQLSFEDETFDWVISQHVFQHLQSPQRAMEEVYRVLKPGGHVCLIDVDDGLSVSYPEQTSFAQLSQLLENVQARRGGDREIGRKLGYLLHGAGFEVLSTRPIVQTQFTSAEDKSLVRTVVAQHFADIRDAAVAQGMIEAAKFDALMDDFLDHPLPYTFDMDTQMVVIGIKSTEA